MNIYFNYHKLRLCYFELGEKKPKNQLNRENRKKNNRKNQTVKKNRLNIFKNRPVWFYKPETGKTEWNPNKKKIKKQNRAKPI